MEKEEKETKKEKMYFDFQPRKYCLFSEKNYSR